MKVIFLDFDGVMNSQGSFVYEHRRRAKYMLDNACDKFQAMQDLGPVNETFDPVCASNLQFILENHADAKIVFSTTWRHLFDMDWLKKKLTEYGIDADRVIDKTPASFSLSRTREIATYLDEHPEVTNYVILDDIQMGPVYAERQVLTGWNEGGLSYADAMKAIKLLTYAKAPRREDILREEDIGD